MKGKKLFSKIVAVMCAVVVFVSSVELPILANTSQTPIPEPSGYTTLLGMDDFVDFAGQESYTAQQGTAPLLQAGSASLNGVFVDGIYNIGKGAAVQFGSKDQYRLHVGVNGRDELVIQFVHPNGAAGAKAFTATDIGCSYVGTDIRMKVGFLFTNENATAGTADIGMKIWIGDTFYYEITATGMPTNKLPRHMYVIANSAPITLKLAPEENPADNYTTEMNVKDFTGQDTYTAATGELPLLQASAESLDGVFIDGVYNIGKGAAVQFGSKDQYRLHVGVNGRDELVIQFVHPKGAAGAKAFTATDIGCSYVGTDIRMKVGFLFTNENATAGTADIGMKIWIGDTFYYEITATGMPMDKLPRHLYVVANTAPITLKAAPILAPEDEFKTVVDAKDITGENERAFNQNEFLSPNNESLDGVLIDGIYNISKYSYVQIGSQDQYRLHMGVFNDETFLIKFVTTISGHTSEYGKVNLTQAQIGSAYKDTDIRIKVGFKFANKNTTAGTADVVMKIWVGEKLVHKIIAEDMPMNKFPQHMYVLAANGPITIKTAETQTPGGSGGSGEGSETPTGPEADYTTVLSMRDFTGKDSYPVTTNELLKASDVSLEDVFIDGIVNITKGGAVQIGSKDQYRLHIGVDGRNRLVVQFVTPSGAVGAQASTDVGFNFIGTDMRMKVGFKFTNKTTNTTDVTMKIWLGDSYTHEITATGVPLDKLPRHINAVATVTLKVLPEQESGEVEVPDYDYTIVNVRALTGEPLKKYTGAEAKPGNDQSINGKKVEGIYNFTGNAAVYFGTPGWYGLRMQLDGANLKYWIADQGSPHDKSITPQQAGLTGTTFAGADVTIKVGMHIMKTNPDGTVELVYHIEIGDYSDAFILSNVNPASTGTGFILTQRLHVCPGTGSLTIKKMPVDPSSVPEVPDYDYTMIGMETFILGAEATYTGEAKPGNNNTMDGYMLEGLYNLTKDACVYIGTADWYGLRVQLLDGNLKYWIAPNTSDYDNTVTPQDANIDVTSFEGVDVPIKVGMHIASTNPNNTVNLAYEVHIGDYTTEFLLQNVSPTQFGIGQRVHVVPGTGTVILKAMPGAVPEVPDGFAPTYDTAMKFTDFGITADMTVAGGEQKPNGGDTLSLDGVMVEGTYSFSGLESAAYIGSRGWGGLRFGGSADGFTCQFIDNGGQGALYRRVISEEETGCELMDKDVRIKAGFIIVSENEDGTLNVIIEVQIGNYQDVFALNKISKGNFIRGMHLYAAEDSSVTLKVDQADLEYIDEPDDKKLSYDKEMTFYDFAITKDYVVENKQTRVRVANETLDGVSIEGTYFITGRGILGFGGDWRGLQIQRAKNGMTYQYLDVDGKGAIYSKTITEEDTGCALYDEDLDIKVGFNFSNEDKAVGIADVTIEVNIGPTYRDVFTVKGVRTANLQKWMLLYAADGDGFTGSKLILRKPYMEPFKFEEFGFTKNWKAELKLK